MNKNATYDVRRALHNIDDHTVLVVDVVDVVVLVVEVESLHSHQPETGFVVVVVVAVGSSRDDVLIEEEEGIFVFDGGTSLQPNQPGV